MSFHSKCYLDWLPYEIICHIADYLTDVDVGVKLAMKYPIIILKVRFFAEIHRELVYRTETLLSCTPTTFSRLKLTHSREHCRRQRSCSKWCYSYVYPYCKMEQPTRFAIEELRYIRLRRVDDRVHFLRDAKDLFERRVKRPKIYHDVCREHIKEEKKDIKEIRELHQKNGVL